MSPGPRSAPGPRMRLYGELAEFYDALYSWKNYRDDCRRVLEVVRTYGPRRPTSWLDVACGTGRHLEVLRERFRVVGVDGSRAMLRVARRRLPEVPLHLGDMRTFRLRERFDVVSCLFSGIGHFERETDVRAAFANFARHLNPGGVVVVESWILPDKFRPSSLHVNVVERPEFTIVRTASSSRAGDRSVIRYDYLVARPGERFRHLAETDVGLLLSKERLVDAMRAAGLRGRFLFRGLHRDRGLAIGRAPAA